MLTRLSFCNKTIQKLQIFIFYKIAASGQCGFPNNTIVSISRHFWYISYFVLFVTKWPLEVILDVQNHVKLLTPRFQVKKCLLGFRQMGNIIQLYLFANAPILVVLKQSSNNVWRCLIVRLKTNKVNILWTICELFTNYICVHRKFLNSSWTVMMNCSWTFVHEPATLTFCELVCELFMNYFWVHNKFLNSSWTDDELFINVYLFNNNVNFSWTFVELFMNYFKFLNSSWTVMVNCSWTLVHEPTMWAFHELFMDVHECSWKVHKVMNSISPGKSVIGRKWMKWWCFRPLLCTLFMLNWTKQTPGIMRRN